MPTIAEFDGIRVCIYADDHPPPHFHILHTGRDVAVRISDLAVIAGSLPRPILRRAIEWAAGNQAQLALRWLQLNEE
ncbi:MAG: DUF4160 domain-containing protein [Alphaproteobacteria bacterium]